MFQKEVQSTHVKGDKPQLSGAHKLVGVVHVWVAPIPLLQQAPARVAMQCNSGVVQGRPRLGKGKEVQAALAVKKAQCRCHKED